MTRVLWWPHRWLSLLAILCLSSTLHADTIQGYILHAGTQQRLADVEVAFLIGAEDGAMSPMASTRSDAQGQFDFAGPFLVAGTRFALSADYEGVQYPSSVLQVGEQDEIIIEVYGASNDASNLRITNHNIFLGIVDDALEAAHLVQAQNGGELTYVGPRLASSDHDQELTRGLEFVVPAQLASLTPHTGELIRLSATRICDTQPLPPGSSQVAFTFRVAPEAFDGTFVHEAVYPTQHLDLFIQPVDVELGPDFQDLGIVDLHSQRYRHYRAHDLLPGQRLSVELPFAVPLRWALKWALMALVPAVLLAVIAITRRPSAAQEGAPSVNEAAGKVTQSSPPALSEREQILQQLAAVRRRRADARGEAARQLDHQYQQLMAQARDIYRQSPSA